MNRLHTLHQTGKPWVHYEPGLCFLRPCCSFSFFGGNGIWGGATSEFLLTLTPSFQQIQAFSCVFPNPPKTLDSESRYSAFHTIFFVKKPFLNSKKTGWNKKSSWWFQPIWKIWVKMGSSSPRFGVKIPKMFELPPPRKHVSSKWPTKNQGNSRPYYATFFKVTFKGGYHPLLFHRIDGVFFQTTPFHRWVSLTPLPVVMKVASVISVNFSRGIVSLPSGRKIQGFHWGEQKPYKWLING